MVRGGAERGREREGKRRTLGGSRLVRAAARGGRRRQEEEEEESEREKQCGCSQEGHRHIERERERERGGDTERR